MNEKAKPSISVIMAVYNGEAHLCDAVSSILHQTFEDFEYIIINDGSTDTTADILESLTDPRILVVHNNQNKGLPYSLNTGLSLAQGKYIARMDADDLALPDRLEKQITFLEEHPEVGIVGSGCIVTDETGKELGIKRFPTSDAEIRWVLLLTNPFLHTPSVMLRTEILCRYHLKYDITFQATQDYELWTRLLEYTRGANLKDELVVFRRSHRCISAQFRDTQLKNQDAVILRTIRRQFSEFTISPEQVTQLRESFIGGIRPKREFETKRAELACLYLDLLMAFAKKHRNENGMQALQRKETQNIASLVFQLKFYPFWLPVLPRILKLHPGVVRHLLHNSAKALRRSTRRLLSKGYRRLIKGGLCGSI